MSSDSDPYSPPRSEVRGEALDSTVLVGRSILVFVVALLVLGVALYVVTPILAREIIAILGVSSETIRLAIDAVLSFGLAVVIFGAVYSIPRVASRTITYCCALSVFLFWALESGFFFSGLNPQFPVWYEINMALNDLAAAITAQLLARKKR